MDVSIRAASDSDLHALVRLNGVVQRLHAALEPDFFKAVTDDAAVAAFFASTLAASANTILLAESDGRPAGYVWFETQQRPETCLTLPTKRIYVHHMAVDHAVQRMGVGSALMRNVEVAAMAADIRHITLSAWVMNRRAQAFFAAHGFSAVQHVLRRSL